MESNEYSKSGGDSASAQATDDAAFNPQKTSPEEEHESARQEAGGVSWDIQTGGVEMLTVRQESNNPLSVSPANPEISKPRGAQEGGAQGSPEETGSGSGRERTSGGGSAQKSGGGSSG